MVTHVDYTEQERIRSRRKAVAKLEAKLRLIQAIKEVLRIGPYIQGYCYYCSHNNRQDHADDCVWLHLRRETMAYENKYLKGNKDNGPQT